VKTGAFAIRDDVMLLRSMPATFDLVPPTS
jgi:hypothetical protein